jgi:hypothetical protein
MSIANSTYQSGLVVGPMSANNPTDSDDDLTNPATASTTGADQDLNTSNSNSPNTMVATDALDDNSPNTMVATDALDDDQDD